MPSSLLTHTNSRADASAPQAQAGTLLEELREFYKKNGYELVLGTVARKNCAREDIQRIYYATDKKFLSFCDGYREKAISMLISIEVNLISLGLIFSQEEERRFDLPPNPEKNDNTAIWKSIKQRYINSIPPRQASFSR